MTAILSTESDTCTSNSRFDAAIIGIVGLPAQYGGFETLADQLVKHLGPSCRLLVFCSRKATQTHPERFLHAQLEYLDWDANGWQSIIYDALAIYRSLGRSRTLLILGVSGCIVLPVVRLLKPRVRIVTNIDGLEWKREKWGYWAKKFLQLSEAAAVRFSHCVIADNLGIQQYVAARYKKASELIPYGGDSDALPAEGRFTRFAPKDYFLTVCRIEPENRVHEILAAFAGVPDKRLVVVGNWAVSPFAQALREQYAAHPNIELLDAIYDAGILKRLRSEAVAYVHGHSAGGTNPSLVEAMNVGLAVLAFDVNYNRHTLEDTGGFWDSVRSLQQLLESVSDRSLATWGRAALEIARRRYTWRVISEQYARAMAP